MTYQEKVKAIYEAMADKTLSFGCKMQVTAPEGFERYDSVFYNKDDKFFVRKELYLIYVDKSSRGEPYRYEVAMGIGGYHSYEPFSIEASVFQVMLDRNKIQILGHEPHLGQVVQRIQKNKNGPDFFDIITTTVDIRPKDKLSQPLPLNPTEERYPVIDFITSLLDQGS